LKEMSDSVAVWFVIAVLLFWSMGAYNRLMRLRSLGLVAFAALEGLLNQYGLLVNTNFPDADVARSLPDSSQAQNLSAGAWVGLAAAVEQLNATLKMAHAQPLKGSAMGALRTAFEALCLSWTRLRDLPPDLAGSAPPGTLQSQWEQVTAQVDVARTEFNKRVVNYNEAIAQFPALLLAKLSGFKPAQPI
jgi:LemA protein